jgi:hypothetical protein
MEIRPKVKCPDHTDDGIAFGSRLRGATANDPASALTPKPHSTESLAYNASFDAENSEWGESKVEA